MLARKFRLPKAQKLRKVRLLRAPAFSIKIAENNLALSRFGFVVSKRIDRRAVARNRFKRRLRQCVEERILTVRPGYDVTIVAHQAIKDAPVESLCQQVEKALRNLGVV